MFLLLENKFLINIELEHKYQLYSAILNWIKMKKYVKVVAVSPVIKDLENEGK